MCEGFGGFYHKSGKVYFCEPDSEGDCSHRKTTLRLPKGIDESDLVPFQIPDWKKKSFEWDTANKPDWAGKSAEKLCLDKLAEVSPVWKEYKKVTALALAEDKKVCDAAWEEYKKVCDAALEEYKKVCAPALAEYDKVCDAAWEEDKKVCDAALEEYKKVCAPALAEYDKVRDAAWAEYKKVSDAALEEMIESFKLIDGYCE